MNSKETKCVPMTERQAAIALQALKTAPLQGTAQTLPGFLRDVADTMKVIADVFNPEPETPQDDLGIDVEIKEPIKPVSKSRKRGK